MIGSVIARLGGRAIEERQFAAGANNFNLVRLLLASFVIWSHSVWLLNGGVERDEISDLVGHTVAYLAVDGFFFVSGMLVSQSLFRQSGVLRFAALRIGRIWPGLAVSLLGTIAVFALLSGRPLAYLADRETLLFLFKNLAQIKAHYFLPGLAPGDPPLVVNGSLWTIPWELRCYVVLALFYAVVAAWRARALAAVALASVAVCAAWALAFAFSPVLPDVSQGFGYNLAIWMRMWGCFSTGIVAAIWWRRIAIVPWGPVPLWLGAWVEHQWAGTALLAPLAMFYTVLVVAFGQRAERAATAGWPDFSYGVYIYGFPVMIVVQLAWPMESHPWLALATLAATVPVAALSWFLVEKPALGAAKRLSKRLPAPSRSAVPDDPGGARI